MNQERTSDRSTASKNAPRKPESSGAAGDDQTAPEKVLAPRNSLTVAGLAALGASNNSTPVFQQNAVRTLHTELNADAVLVIDYTDAFGTKCVRAVSGMDLALVGSEVWLPDWLTPVDVDAPVKLTDVNPVRLSAATTFAPGSEYRSALAVAIPGITGASGMIVALAERGIEFDEVQIETVKTIASLISMSASRSNVRAVAQRDETQLTVSQHIARTDAHSENGHSSSLQKIADQLGQFFEFEVIAIRTLTGDQFETESFLTTGQQREIPVSNSVDSSVEFRAVELQMAVSDSQVGAEAGAPSAGNPAWKSAGIESTIAIPVNHSATQVIVLGSTRFEAFTTEQVSIANRLVPALTAAFASDSPTQYKATKSGLPKSSTPDYLQSIASATELNSACGVIATQVTVRTGASRVKIGFIDEESGRAQLGFDTEPTEDSLDSMWIAPEEIGQLTKFELNAESGEADSVPGYSSVRIPLKVSDRIVGYVEALHDAPGFDEGSVVDIKEISDACATVVANLKQLEQSRYTLEKLEMLNRVCDQIRLDESENPLRSSRIASLIRNLFDADWLYFGSIDHENDLSITDITDGLNVPELAPGVKISRRSLLIPLQAVESSPVTVDIESAAPGQRASGRWMYRAGLRSALCASLSLDQSIAAMFMCGSRNPSCFGSLEKKLASKIVFELDAALERASAIEKARTSRIGSSATLFDQPDPNLQAILNNTSVLVLTLDKAGIVTDATGRGIETLKLTPDLIMGRNFVTYSRRISKMSDSLKNALNGQSSRVEFEIFGTVVDVWMEPITSSKGVTTGASLVLSDVTDRLSAIKAESMLVTAQEDTERSRKFIASLSHEMKSPLTTVVALIDLLSMNERGNLHPDQLERIEVVQQNADRLTLLVNDFLNISKMEAGTFEINPAEFKITDLRRDLETSFAPTIEGRDQTLAVTSPGEDQSAGLDRELIRQAIMNLLSNASKYSPSHTTISLDIWIDSHDLRITVTDEGPGIPQAERDTVFEPYHQLDNPGVPGTGMGLTIVRQIVELHKGSVWIEDGVGGGTSFAIWLPDSVTTA